MSDLPHLAYRSAGRIGADRLVAVVRAGAAALDDPGAAETGGRDVRVLFVRMPVLTVDDPEAFGGETPDEEHTAALVALLRQEGASAETPIGLVGVGEVGWRAIGAAAALGAGVDRLALVAVTVPDSPLDRDDAAALLARVAAKTLVADAPPSTRASWIRKARGEARVEIVPGVAALSLGDVWARVLSHTAPGTIAR